MAYKGPAHSSFDPKTGIKTFKSKEKCDYAYQAQIKAHKVGAAPPVIKRIDDFSYQTAVADTSFFMENLKAGVYYNKIFPELAEKLKPILKDNPWAKWGPDKLDMARHNLGLWEGKVVMIDFS